jgi:hypothetical protein
MIRIYVILIVMILASAGCATPERRVKVDTVEVKVPVKVACIDADKVPKEPVYQYGAGIWPGTPTALSMLIADLEAAKQYGREWSAVAIPCVK